MDIFPKKVGLVAFDAPYFVAAEPDVANSDTLPFWIEVWAQSLNSPRQGQVLASQVKECVDRHNLEQRGRQGRLCASKWYPTRDGYVFNKALCELLMRGHNKSVIEQFFEKGACQPSIALLARDSSTPGHFRFAERVLATFQDERLVIAAPFGQEFEKLQKSLGQGAAYASIEEALPTFRRKADAPPPELLTQHWGANVSKEPVGIMEFRSIMGMCGRNSVPQLNKQYLELTKDVEVGFTKELLLAAYEIAFEEKAEGLSLSYVCAILGRAHAAIGDIQYLNWVTKDHLKAICAIKADLTRPLRAIMLTAHTAESQEYIGRKLLEALGETARIRSQMIELLISDFQVQESSFAHEFMSQQSNQTVDLLLRW